MGAGGAGGGLGVRAVTLPWEVGKGRGDVGGVVGGRGQPVGRDVARTLGEGGEP